MARLLFCPICATQLRPRHWRFFKPEGEHRVLERCDVSTKCEGCSLVLDFGVPVPEEIVTPGNSNLISWREALAKQSHAEWCSGPNERQLQPHERCIVSSCTYDTQWMSGTCECRSRGWGPGLEDHQHDYIWLHNGKHLICKICGLDGT